MFRKLKFEQELYDSLNFIPLSTQYKMDLLGVKFRRESWMKLSLEARQLFCHMSVRTDEDKESYRRYLVYLLKRLRRQVTVLEPPQINKEKSEWENTSRIPLGVYQMVVNMGFTLFQRDWFQLDEFQRYVLSKLSRGNHDREYLNRALGEILPAPAKISAWKMEEAKETLPEPVPITVNSVYSEEAVLTAS
jgi:hypothetical protein